MMRTKASLSYVPKLQQLLYMRPHEDHVRSPDTDP